ncbi:acidic repeat-containing protein-like [Papaver somniferum]|uniref:acidic repeat-containing protein-like n=1 Tax=Papaver somniferum TaxID=3469 RepID=UPI000E6F8876|nr:acidic repeat-containing protein-like [Papaver somniferum]
MNNDNDDDDDDDDDDEQGGKGGDMQGDDNDKEGSKGGDNEHGTESEKNEVPYETPEKQSTPSPKTNEENEEEVGKDGTSLGVESEIAKTPSTPLSKAAEIPEDQEDHMNLIDQDVMDTAQTDEIEKVAGCEDNLSETVFVKLEKGCYKMAVPEVKENMETLIRHDCPRFQLLSQEDTKEESSQKSLSNEAMQFIQQNASEFFSSQEVEEYKTPVVTRSGKMREADMSRTQAAGKLSKTPQKRDAKKKLDPQFTAEGKTRRVRIKSDQKGKGVKLGQEPGYLVPLKRKA